MLKLTPEMTAVQTNIVKHWGLTTPSADYGLYFETRFHTKEHVIYVHTKTSRTRFAFKVLGRVEVKHDIFLDKDVTHIQEQIDAICAAHRLGLNT